MKSVKVWIKGARIYTLPIGLVPVVMAFAISLRMMRFSHFEKPIISFVQCFVQFFLCCAVAVFMQVAVNYANDYCDGLNGLDENRKFRPVSKSKNSKPLCDVSWRLADAGIKSKSVLKAVIVSAVISCIAGLLIVFSTGILWFIPLGIACIAAAWFYAGGKHPYGYKGFGELSAFVFFGPVPFIGSLCAITHGIGVQANNIFINSPLMILACVLMSFIPGAYSACLMMVNNLRDIASDKEHGKITAMIRLGEQSGRRLCAAASIVAALLLLAYSVLIIVFPFEVPSIWSFYSSEVFFSFSEFIRNISLHLFFAIFQWFILVALVIKAYKFAKCILKGDYKNSFALCVAQAIFAAAVVLLSAII